MTPREVLCPASAAAHKLGWKGGYKMEEALLLARSITGAQRMDAALRRRGVTAELIRAPAGLTRQGCAYALHLPWRKLADAMQILTETGQTPYQIFYRNRDEVREVLP